MKTLFSAVVLALLATCYIFFTQNKIHRQRAEIDRLAQNIWSLNNDKRYFRFRDSLKAVEMSTLVLKNNELKQLRNADAKLIADLRDRPTNTPDHGTDNH